MLRFKSGVRVQGLRVEALIAMQVAQTAYAERGYDCIVTSALDGKHSATSLHYTGAALDFRIRHLPQDGTAEDIAGDIEYALTDDYDVVLEETHIHVEYQPRFSG